jgi:hypothetical protein
MRFCTRDGAKLSKENLPSVSSDHSLTYLREIDGESRQVLEPSINNGVQETTIFPFSSLTSNTKENLSPVVASILEEIIKTDSLLNKTPKQAETVFGENIAQVAESLETNQVTQQEFLKAADTRNLTAPAVLPFDTLGQYTVDQVSADRKLLIVLALIVVFSVAGFAAYSIPDALQWSKVSADTQPKSLSSTGKENILDQESVAGEMIGTSKNEEFIQKIDLPKSEEKIASIPNVENKLKDKLENEKVINKIEQKNKDKQNIVSKKGNIKDKKDNNNNAPKQVKVEVTKVNKATNTKNVNESKTNKNYSEKINDKLISKNSKNSNKPLEKNDRSNKKTVPLTHESATSRSQTWEKTSAEQIKSSRQELAKVVAKVLNKSRLQTPNGYVYQFDLVVKELNGVKVKWNYTSARKTTYSGNSSVVSGLLGDEIDANGLLQFRMAVRMTGKSIEDWYGQIIYACSGVDENGNTIELNQILALDNNFPTAR